VRVELVAMQRAGSATVLEDVRVIWWDGRLQVR
jgi:hypothetical protein